MTGCGLRLLQRSGPGALFADLKACNDYRHGIESAAKTQCAFHLVLGASDAMSPPRGAAKLIEELPLATVTKLKASGHMLLAERPNEVLDELIKALVAPT